MNGDADVVVDDNQDGAGSAIIETIAGVTCMAAVAALMPLAAGSDDRRKRISDKALEMVEMGLGRVADLIQEVGEL